MNIWPKSSFHLVPLKRVCSINSEVLPEGTDPDFEMEYIDIGNVTLENGIKERQVLRFKDAPSRARRLVRKGDSIVSTVRTYLKAVAHIDVTAQNWVASTGFAVLRPSFNVDARYLYRVIQSNPFVETVVACSTGVSYPAINPSALGNIFVPLPGLGTQKRIADFLDRETARIDQLIEKKQRLMELLEEKRAVTIFAAVYGLGAQGVASIPLKNGKRTEGRLEDQRLALAPENWTVSRLKYLTALRGGGTPPREQSRYWVDGTIPWVSPKDMKKRVIYDTEEHITPQAVNESATSYVDPGDVLIVVRSGILRHSLPVAIAGVRLTVNQDLKAFSLCDKLLPWFFLYWIEGQSEYLLLEWRQLGATVDSIDVPRMMNTRIAVPDLPTQRRIVDFLDHNIELFDTVRDKTDQSIEKLKVFRSALITAAVTGQIDVDTWRKRGHTERRLEAIEEEMEA